MLRLIIEKEILLILKTPKFIVVFVLFSVLVLLSVSTGISNYKTELNQYRTAQGLNRKNALNQPTYLALAGYGININKPANVLSIFVYGLNGSLGRVANINIARVPELKDSVYSSNPLLAMIGPLDTFFLVNFILSLILILLTFDLIVGEHEQGTLKLILSNSVSRDKIIIGKAIGSFLGFIIPFLIPFLLAIILVLLTPDIHFGMEDFIRVVLMFLSFALYLFIILFISIYVSIKFKKSSVCLLVTLFIWIFFNAIIPKISVIVASKIKEVPSIYTVNSNKEAILSEVQGKAQNLSNKWINDHTYLMQNQQEYLRQYKKFLEKQQQELTTEIQKRHQEIDNEFQLQIKAHRDLAMNLSRISPSSTLMFCTMRLAKTDIDEHERFLNSARQYKAEFTKWVNSRMIHNLDNTNYTVNLDGMPEFRYSYSGLNSTLRDVLLEFIYLILTAVLFFVLSYVAFLKYEI